ncbi:MAG: ABC transporter substrate-binding protein [Chloroflexota bacterium]|nr:MAG: hypothetical protein DIU68_17860 [Chloroflexota bacterium]
MNKVRVLLFLLIVLSLATGVAQAQEERILVIGHAESTDSLDPARGYTQTTGIINRVTYETLVTFPDEDASEILPLLATDWTISDDGLTYTFNLREGVTFANGDPLTAEDVVFSVNRLKYVQGSPSFLTAGIADVTADDESTVTFTLSAPNPAFLANLANNAFSITNAEQVRAAGGTDAEDAASTDAAESFLNSTSAGTGPYILEAWDPQVQTVLVRNENYWGEQPYFDRIIITNIPEAAAQKAALESGEIDLALDLTSDQMVGMDQNPDIAISRGPGNIVHFLLMNANAEQCGPTADPRVQNAIRAALDYEGYIELWGGITPASPMAYGMFTAYGPEHAPSRDLDAARALLEEAGYGDGLDLTLEYPNFTFQGVNMDTNAQKIQADLAEVGINITLAPSELQVALEAYRTGQQCLGYWFWGPDILDPIDTLSFVPGGKVAAERALWTEDLADPEILELRDRALVATDPEERIEIFQQIQDYLQNNGSFAAFLQPDVQTAFRADIQGYIWHPQWLVDVSRLSRAE